MFSPSKKLKNYRQGEDSAFERWIAISPATRDHDTSPAPFGKRYSGDAEPAQGNPITRQSAGGWKLVG